jgi:arginase
MTPVKHFLPVYDDGGSEMVEQENGRPPVEMICVPWSIGLRPDAAGREPGTWDAPRVLREAGLGRSLGAVTVTELPRPPYDAEAQPGTRVRNGLTLRRSTFQVADAVSEAIGGGRLPVVVGGDCSLLLGCLYGARRHHETGLAHIDAHPDFTRPGDFSGLGAAAGMDLALATGHGEMLLTHWPDVNGPLVEEHRVVQLGDRTGQSLPSGLLVIGIAELLAMGEDAAVRRVVERLHDAQPIWVHVDLDVLDAAVLPAVDSPGTPGLTYEQLARLLSRLRQTGRVLGIDITIYDPHLDPDGIHAPEIVDCIAAGLAGVPA